MRSITGKSAIIIGGTGDIGAAVARLFCDAGATVTITGRELEAVTAKAGQIGPDVAGVVVNPREESSLRQLFEAHGAVDFLLLTLGTQAVSVPFMQLTDADLQRALDEKYFYYVRALRAAWGSVRESVTWLTGGAPRAAVPGLSNYAAMSGVLHGMMRPLAMEMAPVRLNCVAAGLTRTNFWNRLAMPSEEQAQMYEQAARVLPVGHVADSMDIAEALYFAATNRYTTGTILDTSGGLPLGTISHEKRAGAFGGTHRR